MNVVAVASMTKKVTSLFFYLIALVLLTAVGMELASRLNEKHFSAGTEPPRHFPVLLREGESSWRVVRLGEMPKEVDYEILIPPLGRGHVTGGEKSILANYQVEETAGGSRHVTLQWVTDDYTFLAKYEVSAKQLTPLSLRKRGVGEAILGFVGALGGIALFRRWRRVRG